MSISEKSIFPVDSSEKRGIIMQTSKAATKPGLHTCRPERDPLCCEGPAPADRPTPSEPPSGTEAAASWKAGTSIARPRTSDACPYMHSFSTAQYGGTGPPVTASKSGGLGPQAGWNRG